MNRLRLDEIWLAADAVKRLAPRRDDWQVVVYDNLIRLVIEKNGDSYGLCLGYEGVLGDNPVADRKISATWDRVEKAADNDARSGHEWRAPVGMPLDLVRP